MLAAACLGHNEHSFEGGGLVKMQAEIGRQVTRMCRFPILEPQKPERGGSEVHLRMISKGGETGG